MRLGLLIGQAGLESLKAIGTDTFQEWGRVTLDARSAVAATLGLSVLTSFCSASRPRCRPVRFDITAALSDGGSRNSAVDRGRCVRRLLVVSEVALGVVLLVAAGLLIRTFVGLRSLDPGSIRHSHDRRVSPQDARTSKRLRSISFEESSAALERTPGIESAAVSLELPYMRLLNSGFTFADEAPDPSYWPMANFMYVTPRFFDVLRMSVRHGRALPRRIAPARRSSPS